MSLARSKASHDAAIATSLSKLGAARRERLSEEDYEVYVEGLREFALEAVQTVCAALAQTTPEDFGPRFPTLGAIRAAIVDHLRRQREAREANTRVGRKVMPS
jgi:hypothetical protein